MADPSLRLDRWLWAARFFKTRTLAAAAVSGGKVRVNGERAKPARAVRVGDRLSIRVGPYVYDVEVRALADRRGPGRLASTLYAETPASQAARRELAEQLRIAPSIRYQGKGRPTKKDRRRMERLKGRSDSG
ncbi:MAG TPA: RNA-binding S4 domain-containing protein [Gemmatimonadales bacterium]|nr:RNA-binding S4 domain-containing protein [Gemmatimonadales bacterium]